jgi:hypothetical protein
VLSAGFDEATAPRKEFGQLPPSLIGRGLSPFPLT